MGIYCDYFTAAADDMAVTAADKGPSEQGFDTVSLKGVDPVVAMGQLESLLAQVPYERIAEDPGHGVDLLSEDGVWIFALRLRLQEALVATDDAALTATPCNGRAAPSSTCSTPKTWTS